MQMRERCLLLALLLGSAACGGSDGEAATPSTTEAPPATGTSTTTTTAEVDPFTVPDDPADIDEAYVEAVANELYELLAAANRIQVEDGDPSEIVELYNAVYEPDIADVQLSDAFARTEEELARFRVPLGPQTVTVTTILEASDGCIIAGAVRSADKVLVDPPPPLEGLIVLIRREPTVGSLNETSWFLRGFTTASQGDVSCDGS